MFVIYFVLLCAELRGDRQACGVDWEMSRITVVEGQGLWLEYSSNSVAQAGGVWMDNPGPGIGHMSMGLVIWKAKSGGPQGRWLARRDVFCIPGPQY
jgi:hypothetical protein